MTEPASERPTVEGHLNAVAYHGGSATVNVYGSVTINAGAPVKIFRWPSPWDFGAYLEEKRHEFVGRDWLFNAVETWLSAGTERALLVLADYGVGKSAFLAELIHRNPEGSVVAHHCCQHDTHETLNPANFVASVAAQLAHVFPAYAAQVNDEPALQKALEEADRDAASAFECAVVGPLRKMQVPDGGCRCIVIDALDESLEFDRAQGQQKTRNIVKLLSTHVGRLPKWLRVLATTRNRSELTVPLMRAFATTTIDAEDEHNIDDLRNYVRRRGASEGLKHKLAAASMSVEKLVETIAVHRSGGKFLYAVHALNDLEGNRLQVADIASLPPEMNGFYLDAFERRFGNEQENYDLLTGPILAVLTVSQEPMTRTDLAEVLGRSEEEIQTALSRISDFLAWRDKRYTFRHLSLAEWLTGENAEGEAVAGDYHVRPGTAQKQLTAWCRRAMAQGIAHERDYLVRHLAAHLDEPDKATTFARLLVDVRWIKRKLEITDVNVLLSEFRYVTPEPLHEAIEFALRQSRHILTRDDALVQGTDQLYTQLMVRLLHRTEASIGIFCADVVSQARMTQKPWLRPLVPSRQTSSALLGTLTAGEFIIGDNAMVTLPDGRLAAGVFDHTIKLWDLASGQVQETLENHIKEACTLAVLPDGRLALSGDNSIKLWNLTSRLVEVSLEGHIWPVTALAVLFDGRLASGSEDGTIRLWNLASGTAEATLEGHGGAVRALAGLPDGRLASASKYTAPIMLWDLASRQIEAKLGNHFGSSASALAVLPDGRLASGVWGHGTITLWNPDSGEAVATLDGHTDTVRALAVLPDGKLASGANDNVIRLWNLVSGEAVSALIGHSGPVCALAVLCDGSLASGSWDHTVKLWNPNRACDDASHEGHAKQVHALAVLPDGRLVSGSEDQTIKLWNAASGRLESTLEGHTEGVTALAVLPDGRLASGSACGAIKIWNLASGQVEATLGRTEGYRDTGVQALKVLPDGRLASGSADHTIKLWNVANGEAEATLECNTSVDALALLPDGRLVSGSFYGAIMLWNLASGQVEATLGRPKGLFDHMGVEALEVLPDGRLASGSHDGVIRLWNLSKGQVETTLENSGRVTALAVLPDGTLASASRDMTVDLASTAAGGGVQWIARFVADSPIHCIAVVSGDSTVAAGDATGQIHFLRVEGLL